MKTKIIALFAILAKDYIIQKKVLFRFISKKINGKNGKYLHSMQLISIFCVSLPQK